MTNVVTRSPSAEGTVGFDPIVEAYQSGSNEVTLVSIANVLLRHRWLIICSMLVGGVVSAFANYVPFDNYTASTTFAPRTRGQQSATNSVLAQLGLQGASGSGGAYYVEVIRSSRILGPVVASMFRHRTQTGEVRATLTDIYGFKGGEPRHARAGAIAQLRSQIKTSTQTGSGGIMKLSVTTRSPTLSALVAQRLLDELNAFNLATRQEQASNERQFIEARVAEARLYLTDAENAVQQFTNKNQHFLPISPLALEFDRLSREVKLRQELYTSLAKGLDQARIEEVRDNPVLTIIEVAEPPLGPDPRIWPQKAMIGSIFGLLLAIFIAFLHSYVARTRSSYSDEYAELETLKRDMIVDFRRPWRPLGRILATGRP